MRDNDGTQYSSLEKSSQQSGRKKIGLDLALFLPFFILLLSLLFGCGPLAVHNVHTPRHTSPTHSRDDKCRRLTLLNTKIHYYVVDI